MQGVRAGFRYYVDERPGRVPVFCRKLVGNDLEFLNCVLGHESYRATHDVVIEIATVHADARTACCRSTRNHTAIESLGRVVGRRWCRSRNQICKLLEIAIIDGQIGNLYLRYRLLNLRSRSVYLSREAANMDLL